LENNEARCDFTRRTTERDETRFQLEGKRRCQENKRMLFVACKREKENQSTLDAALKKAQDDKAQLAKQNTDLATARLRWQ
jgi:hypothetical protein